MSSALRRTLTGLAIGAVAALLIALDTVVQHGVIVWGVCGCLALGAGGEAAAMEARRNRPVKLGVLAACVAAFGVAFVLREVPAWSIDRRDLQLALPAAAAVLAGLAFGRGRLAAALLGLWIAAPLVALVLWTREFGHAALVALILASKVGDIAGYFFGRRFGKRHPFPRLSPGKTAFGCGASFVFGVAAAALCARYWTLGPDGLGLVGGAVAGVLLNVAAQGGDLLESAVKRRAGVKDSGVLMGASGGLLDVLDSFLLTAPLAYCALPLIAAAVH